MTFLAATLIDVTIVLGLGLVLAAALRRRSAAIRHGVLTAAVISAALMPLLELTLPQLPVVRWIDGSISQSTGMQFSSEGTAIAETAVTTAEPAAAAGSWPVLLIALWASIALATLAGLLVSLWRLHILRSRCTPVEGAWRAVTETLARESGVRTRVQLLQSEDPTLLVTCGLLRPAIILPSGAMDWPEDRQQIVLRHELAHIRRHDAAIQMGAELLRVMQPFNPLVWMTCRRLRQESEFACDDAVLSAGVGATDYAGHLFDIARRLSRRQTAWASAPAIAHPSTLERRIVAMLEHHKNRQPLTWGGWALAAIIALGVSLPLAAVGVAPQAPAPSTSPLGLPATSEAPNVTVAAPATVAKATSGAPAAKAARPAQTSFSGFVQDQTGGRIPGATVTLTHPASQEVRTAVSNASGAFQFANLTPDSYQMTVQLTGFRKVQLPVDLTAGTPTILTLTLQVGALTEEVHVQCKAQPASVLQWFFPTLSAQERPSTPIRIGGSIKPPRKMKDARPVCPTTGTPVDATVILEGTIGVNGIVTDLKPVTSDDAVPARYRDAAMDAVQQWEFTPTLLNNTPVEITFTVTIVFKAA
jgi:beta-lactamase regulating signal transducer with metallopeptidase domain